MQEVLLKRAGEEPGHRSRLTLSANLAPFPPFFIRRRLSIEARVPPSPLASCPPPRPPAHPVNSSVRPAVC